MSNYEGQIFRRPETERLIVMKSFRGKRVAVEFIINPLAAPVVTRRYVGMCLGAGRVMSGAHIPALVMEMDNGTIVIWPSTAILSISSTGDSK